MDEHKCVLRLLILQSTHIISVMHDGKTTAIMILLDYYMLRFSCHFLSCLSGESLLCGATLKPHYQGSHFSA